MLPLTDFEVNIRKIINEYTFSKTRVFLKFGNAKLHQKIRKLIYDTELDNKHKEGRKILKEISFSWKESLVLWNSIHCYIVLQSKSP